MKWTEETPEPKDRTFVMEDGLALRLSVDDDYEAWQHFSLSFGVFSTARTFSECLESWPREAIAEARRRLDAFEEKLNG